MSLNRQSFELPISETDGEVRLIPRVRERYLSPEADTALVQPTGPNLTIWVFGKHRSARFDLPLTEFVAGKPFTRSLHRWGVNVNRWMDVIETDPSGDTETVHAHCELTDADGGEYV